METDNRSHAPSCSGASTIARFRETLRVLERELERLHDVEEGCCGVSLARCHTLIELGKSGPLSLGELSAKLGLDPSTSSRTVDRMVKDGLIERVVNPEDRRAVVLEPTERGRHAFENIERTMDGYFMKMFEYIPAEKHDMVLESLTLLTGALGRCCRDGGCSE